MVRSENFQNAHRFSVNILGGNLKCSDSQDEITGMNKLPGTFPGCEEGGNIMDQQRLG